MSKLHIVRKKLRYGDRYYVYAWRGGPRIHVHDGSYPSITQKILDKQSKAFRKHRKGVEEDTMEALIRDYRLSPEFLKLKKPTQDDYRLWFDRISAEFGTAPLLSFNELPMKAEVFKWRNQWADRPRTADKAIRMVARLLNWAQSNGRIIGHTLTNIESLHTVNKADQVWEEHHWQAWREIDTPPHIMEALEFFRLTGFREKDGVEVNWRHVRRDIIVYDTSKKNKLAVVPIDTSLRLFLNKMEKKYGAAGTIIKNSRGLPWTTSGLKSVFRTKKPEGFDRTIHDLRGTYVTHLILNGATDEEAARVMGWSKERIADIRVRYVSEERVILSLAEKLAIRKA